MPALVAENNTGQGGSHMYAFDVDGDGDVDVVSADDASGWGLSWYEQTTPVASCLGSVATLETALTSCFTKHQIMATNRSSSDLATYGVPYEGMQIASSELAALQFVDMDGDGLPDIVTGKMRLELPYDQAYADVDGVSYLYIFKLVRDANPPQSGKAHFEGHQIDPTCNETCWGTYLEGTTQTPCCTGVGRQIAIGHANLDGIPDICIASKLGLTVFLGQ